VARKCKHTDCLTCPYEDCISSHGPAKVKGKEKHKLTPEEYYERKLEYQRKYNNTHKEQHARYYREHADNIKRRQIEERTERALKENKDIFIWITNGDQNTRIKLSQLSQYESKGWHRGRT